MTAPRTTRNHRLALLGLFCALICLSSAATQQASPPTLDDILQRLEANRRQYDAGVPSLFCDEHVVSGVDPSQSHSRTITDSTFRLKRIVNPDHTTTLEESRSIKTVDGRPATGDDISGPTILRGAFSGGVAVVSVAQQVCMRYKLHPIKPGKPYIVEFTSIFQPRHPVDCLLQEGGFGRVIIDPSTMQVKQMQLTAPNHTLIFPMNSAGVAPSPVTGVWDITVDYAPVPLGSKTFWMPTLITSRMNARGSMATWTFDARYTNYHKLEVTSRIVPATDAAGK